MKSNIFNQWYNPFKKKIVEKSSLDGYKFNVIENVGGMIDGHISVDSSGIPVTQDPAMICFEVHNPMNETIWFKKNRADVMGNDVIEVKPDQFAFIPHRYYDVSCKSGKPITVTEYYGDAKFKKGKIK